MRAVADTAADLVDLGAEAAAALALISLDRLSATLGVPETSQGGGAAVRVGYGDGPAPLRVLSGSGGRPGPNPASRTGDRSPGSGSRAAAATDTGWAR